MDPINSNPPTAQSQPNPQTSYVTTPPVVEAPKSKNKTIIIVIIAVLLLLVLGGGGYYYYQSHLIKPNPTAIVPSITVSPTISVSPQLTKADILIKVQAFFSTSPQMAQIPQVQQISTQSANINNKLITFNNISFRVPWSDYKDTKQTQPSVTKIEFGSNKSISIIMKDPTTLLKTTDLQLDDTQFSHQLGVTPDFEIPLQQQVLNVTPQSINDASNDAEANRLWRMLVLKKLIVSSPDSSPIIHSTGDIIAIEANSDEIKTLGLQDKEGNYYNFLFKPQAPTDVDAILSSLTIK